jgi:ferredoxin-NADP reductase
MLRYIDDTGEPYRVTLIYSNRDRESTPFLDELEALDARADWFRLVATMTQDPDWDGEGRRIDAGMLSDVLGGDLGAYTFVVAGPPAMTEGVVETLKSAGVPEERILSDRFSGY